jgi:hypothetical protein
MCGEQTSDECGDDDQHADPAIAGTRPVTVPVALASVCHHVEV